MTLKLFQLLKNVVKWVSRPLWDNQIADVEARMYTRREQHEGNKE